MEGEGTKLYYFNANGRAMIIRAILYYSKTKFENILIAKENWKTETDALSDSDTASDNGRFL